MAKVNVELDPEDANLIILFLEDIRNKWIGGKNTSALKLDELISKFKNALLLSDKRIAKLMRRN